MSKKILDYSYETKRTLHSFYPMDSLNINCPDKTNYNKYDIIICNRDNIQDDFDNIKKYAHKNSKIIVNIIQESGSLDSFIDFFDNLTKKHIHIKFFLLADADFSFTFSSNVKTFKSYDVSCLTFLDNFCITPHDSQLVLRDLSIYEKESGFMSLNGSMRSQRLILLLEFLNKGYLSNDLQNTTDNYISFLFYQKDSYEKKEFNSFIKYMYNFNYITLSEYSKLKHYNNKFPIKLPGEISERGDRPDIELKHFYKKIINLVTENSAGYDSSDNYKYNTITFTEKTWKPFLTHQLPLFVGLPGSVNVLRNLGFDLFDDFINHDYDNEPNHRTRISMVVTELSRLLQLDAIKYYKNNYTRFVKNYINLHKLKSNGYLKLSDFIVNNDLL